MNINFKEAFASDKCEKIVDLLHFVMHASDVINHLRNKACEGAMHDEPAQFYALLAVLDEALNDQKREDIDSAVDFLEQLANVLFQKTDMFQELQRENQP